MKNYAGRTAGRAAGQVTAVRAAGQGAKLVRGGAGCGLFIWQNLRCGLTAGQVTAGRGGLRAQISCPRRALVSMG